MFMAITMGTMISIVKIQLYEYPIIQFYKITPSLRDITVKIDRNSSKPRDVSL